MSWKGAYAIWRANLSSKRTDSGCNSVASAIASASPLSRVWRKAITRVSFFAACFTIQPAATAFSNSTAPGRPSLFSITGFDAEKDLPTLLARLAPFLPVREGHYSLFHRSLFEWLTGWDDEQDHTLRVWDLDSGQTLRILMGNTDSVSAVAVSPDGRRAVSGSRDRTLRVWDLDSGQTLRILEGHTEPISAVALSPDGRRAVSSAWGKTLRV